jgi:ABC-type Na+ efflux pump permease subunit
MSLFGPVFRFDLVRQTRRALPTYVRLIYLVVLFLTLLLTDLNRDSYYRGDELRPGAVSRMVEEFCSIFLILQFLLVVGLTPALTGGSITEEKEKQTMPFLLASSLRNHEIVLGKLGSRLISILMIVIAGFPVFSLLQLLGGIDPEWLLAGFLATGATLVSLAAVSIVWSVLLSRSRDAILLAYLSLPAYLLVAHVFFLFAGNATGPFGVMAQAFNAGNPVRAFHRSLNTLYRSGESLDEVLGEYLLFHGIVTIVSLLVAITQVRRCASYEASSPAEAIPLQETRRVDDHPVQWRELHVEAGPQMHWLARGVLFLFVFLSFLPLALIYTDGNSLAHRESESNYWVRTVGTLIACLLLLAVSVRAACSLTGERQKQTLDSLLTTPLESREILGGKWLGAVGSNHPGWCWLGCIGLFAMCSGGLSVMAVPMLTICWFIQASFMASLGLYFSVRCRTTLQSIAATITAALLLWFGPAFCLASCVFAGAATHGIENVTAGLTPPATLWILAFSPSDVKDMSHFVEQMLFYIILGQIVWASVAAGLWGAIERRFQEVTGRK